MRILSVESPRSRCTLQRCGSLVQRVCLFSRRVPPCSGRGRHAARLLAQSKPRDSPRARLGTVRQPGDNSLNKRLVLGRGPSSEQDRDGVQTGKCDLILAESPNKVLSAHRGLERKYILSNLIRRGAYQHLRWFHALRANWLIVEFRASCGLIPSAECILIRCYLIL